MSNSRLKNIWTQISPLTSKSLAPALLIVYILMITYFGIINPLFLSFGNFKVLLTTAPIMGIVAIGMGIVLISGNIDISVGANVGVISVAVATMIDTTFLPIPVVVLIGITIGLAIGAINGVIVSYIGVNSVIVTLGMWALLRGLALAIAQGTISFRNEAFQKIGRGQLFGVIPNTLFYMVVLGVLMYCILRWTKFGRSVYLVGADSLSAKAVGINVKLIKFIPFLISGAFAAFAAIVFISQTASGFARFGTASYGGTGWEFRALTMCIVGGLSVSGGRGTYVGLLIAFLILGSLTSGLTFINMPLNWRDFFEGAILIVFIILDSRRARRTELIV